MKYAIILVATSSGGSTPVEAAPTVIATASTAEAMNGLLTAINAALSNSATQQAINSGAQLAVQAVAVDGNPVVGATLTPETNVYKPTPAQT